MAEPPSPSLDDRIGSPPQAAVGSDNASSPSSVTPYDPAKNQDEVRSNIAYWLVGGLLFVIFIYCVVALLSTGSCRTAPDCAQVSLTLAVVREFLAVALASITGLVGAVTGFYFGAQTAKKG